MFKYEVYPQAKTELGQRFKVGSTVILKFSGTETGVVIGYLSVPQNQPSEALACRPSNPKLLEGYKYTIVTYQGERLVAISSKWCEALPI